MACCHDDQHARQLSCHAGGIFGTGTCWPDVIVAAIMGGLGLWGGWQIVMF